jgi:hypothetical protein
MLEMRDTTVFSIPPSALIRAGGTGAGGSALPLSGFYLRAHARRRASQPVLPELPSSTWSSVETELLPGETMQASQGWLRRGHAD